MKYIKLHYKMSKTVHTYIKNSKITFHSVPKSPFSFLCDNPSASSIVSGRGILIVSGKENTRTLAINARLPKKIDGRLS